MTSAKGSYISVSRRGNRNSKGKSSVQGSSNKNVNSNLLRPGSKIKTRTVNRVRARRVGKKTQMSLYQAKLMGILVKNNLTRDQF